MPLKMFSDVPVPGEVISVLSHFTDPAILLGMDYKVLAANAPYQRIYGDDAFVDKQFCYEVSHGYTVPCDQAGESCPMKSALEQDAAQKVLHIHHTPRGEEHVEVETCPIHDDDGNVVYLIEIIRNSRMASAQPEGAGMVGRSKAFNRMLELVHKAAPSNISVLLQGESGTGKEVVAKALHEGSARAQKPWVPLECSGLSEMLFESELFGHEKGSFTGAHAAKVGLVEAAEDGTLFLDEIGDVPLNLQVKLLRLLESGTYRRVGSLEPKMANFRLVCATHRNLKQMVEDGTFRQDLYYRISTFPIYLPTLRERREDIPLLARHLLQRIAGKSAPEFHPDTLLALQAYDFPGNVRELRNILEWALLMADGHTIMPAHLPDDLRGGTTAELPSAHSFTGGILPLASLEQDYLRWAVATHGDDRAELARQLGVSERTLYRKLANAKAEAETLP